MKHLFAVLIASVPAAIVAVRTWPDNGDDDVKMSAMCGDAMVFLAVYVVVAVLWQTVADVRRWLARRSV